MIYAVWLGSKGWVVRFEGRFYKLNQNVGFGEGLKIVIHVTKNIHFLKQNWTIQE